MKDKNTKAIGFLFILFGALCNVWVLGRFFSPFGKITTPQFGAIIWGLDILLIAAGVGIFIGGKQFMRKLLFIFFIIVLMTAAIEAGLHFTNLFIPLEDKKKDVLDAPLHDAEGWEQEYKEDYRKSVDAIRYNPFEVWARTLYNGKHINVDSDGRRKTWNPPGFKGKPANLYVFGGSTVWGYGVRDDHTIPSALSRILSESGYEFIVTNYGEEGYTLKQEIIRLMMLLQKGHTPDYVIFYDGVNDVGAAYQAGKAGGHYEFELILKEPIRLAPIDHIIIGTAEAVKKYSFISKALGKLWVRFLPGEPKPIMDDETIYRLSEDIIEDYTNSIRFVEKLSSVYGFKYLFFWQPVVFTEKTLLGAENRLDTVDETVKDKTFGKLFNLTNDSLKNKNIPFFYNISDAISSRTKPYYFDFSHLSETGNAVMAKKIAGIFIDEHLKGKSTKKAKVAF